MGGHHGRSSLYWSLSRLLAFREVRRDKEMIDPERERKRDRRRPISPTPLFLAPAKVRQGGGGGGDDRCPATDTVSSFSSSSSVSVFVPPPHPPLHAQLPRVNVCAACLIRAHKPILMCPIGQTSPAYWPLFASPALAVDSLY